MTAQEIFRLPAIDFIEAEICDLYWQYERHCYYNKAEKEAIKQLLAVRKRLLDKEFVMGKFSIEVQKSEGAGLIIYT